MAYNNNEVLKDLQGNTIPQYYNPVTDSYEPLEGSDGANKVVILDANGSEVVSTQVVQPILDKLDQLTGTVLAEENRKVFEDYDPLKQYYVGNKVSYQGSSYYTIVEPPVGTLPTDANYFLLIAEKGDTGNGITNITDNLDGTITITYGEGQTVNITFIGNVASNISYNNSTSELTATTVQDAIDELDGVVDTKLDSSDIANNLTTTTTGMALDATQGKVINDSLVAHKADFMPHGINNAGFHNSIFRGKYLGSSVTTEQYNAISSGTFEDLYIGDYWTINGINWRIAAFNYYRNTGDSLVPGNHLVIVSDESLYSHVMNDTHITTGGYTGSKMYTEGLTQAKTAINNAFPGHVVTIRAYLCNVVTDGKASGGALFDSTVDLMNEVMVYGSVVNGASVYGLYNIGTEKSQLPLFALNPQSINTRYSYWLRDVASASYFAHVSLNGIATLTNAGNSIAVRPRFLIS